MTAQEPADLRLVVRLVKWALGLGLISAFTFGAWVARLQSQVSEVPLLVADHREWRQVVRDMLLLQCARTGLNDTERAVCAQYTPSRTVP